MNVTVHAPSQQTLFEHLPQWQKRRSRRLSEALLEAVLLLRRLTLAPLIPMLSKLYAPAPRGRPPFAPTCMLRALVRMSILRSRSIELFAQDLSRKPRRAIIAGFEPFEPPSGGAF